jgi:Fe2+ or Zn2+ uptake regulation protein
MPHIDDVLSSQKLTDQQQAVLAYLEAHPNEVFSSEDVEELRAKVGAGTPASLGATLETLYRMGCIERQKVRARYFYGSSEAIGRVRTRMTETASERAQRET